MLSWGSAAGDLKLKPLLLTSGHAESSGTLKNAVILIMPVHSKHLEQVMVTGCLRCTNQGEYIYSLIIFLAI